MTSELEHSTLSLSSLAPSTQTYLDWVSLPKTHAVFNFLHQHGIEQLCSHTRQFEKNQSKKTAFCAYQILGTGKFERPIHNYDYIQRAIDAGADALLLDDENHLLKDCAIPIFIMPKLGCHLGEIASVLTGEQNLSKLLIIGITGTNGKTTISHWLAQAAQKVFKNRWGSIGTLGSGFLDDLKTTGFTTPDPLQLHEQLQVLHQAGAAGITMEVSSHGLDQHRVQGVPFHTAIFSNLSQDHLDYHANMHDYLMAKTRLFTQNNLQYAILNADDAHIDDLLAHSKARVNVVYGMLKSDENQKSPLNFDLLRQKSAYYIGMVDNNVEGPVEVYGRWDDVDYHARLNLPVLGRFNQYNAMAVLAGLLSLGAKWTEAIHAIQTVQAVPGRLELVHASPKVVVDYAHTPDALTKVLQTLLPATTGHLWCVFGCGGNRDPLKRPLMVEAVRQFAHHMVITSDNPRFEDPANIVKAMLANSPNHQNTQNMPSVVVELDRKKAIHYALEHAKPDDTILIAGKGHEQYQDIQGIKHHFSDQNIVREFFFNF